MHVDAGRLKSPRQGGLAVLLAVSVALLTAGCGSSDKDHAAGSTGSASPEPNVAGLALTAQQVLLNANTIRVEDLKPLPVFSGQGPSPVNDYSDVGRDLESTNINLAGSVLFVLDQARTHAFCDLNTGPLAFVYATDTSGPYGTDVAEIERLRNVSGHKCPAIDFKVKKVLLRNKKILVVEYEMITDDNPLGLVYGTFIRRSDRLWYLLNVDPVKN